MSLGLQFRVTGNEALEDRLKRYPKVARRAARLAINDTVRRTRREAKRRIMRQVNLPAGYLDGRGGEPRLQQFFATDQNLVGSVVGRRRPTSLARFGAQQLYADNRSKGGKKRAGVTVNVGGARKKIPRGFLTNLRAGNRDGGNVGLAIRVPKGKQPNRRYRAKPLYRSASSDVYLLYGPSVQQVFDDVAPDMAPEMSAYLNQEFTRQFDRLYGG